MLVLEYLIGQTDSIISPHYLYLFTGLQVAFNYIYIYIIVIFPYKACKRSSYHRTCHLHHPSFCLVSPNTHLSRVTIQRWVNWALQSDLWTALPIFSDSDSFKWPTVTQRPGISPLGTSCRCSGCWRLLSVATWNQLQSACCTLNLLVFSLEPDKLAPFP